MSLYLKVTLLAVPWGMLGGSIGEWAAIHTYNKMRQVSPAPQTVNQATARADFIYARVLITMAGMFTSIVAFEQVQRRLLSACTR
jgi:hypothetical protein